jgi:hypothetical protein
MNPVLLFLLGGVVGMLFKDNVKSGLRGVAKSGVRSIKGLSENIEDLKAEVAESEQRAVKANKVD